jgi:general secretion pathway protein G
LRRAGQRNAKLTIVDLAIFVVVAAVVAAVAIPVIEKATERAQHTTLLENLRVLREQIELYKLQHGGTPPVLQEGGFPQLIRATDPLGRMGPPGKTYSLGPYLRFGVPLNPVTSRSIVTPADSFPPKAASGNGGWLYHQPTGQIAIDLEEYLDR